MLRSVRLMAAFGKAGHPVNDYLGTRVPPTNRPYMKFSVTTRAGGGLLDPFAIRLLHNQHYGGQSLSTCSFLFAFNRPIAKTGRVR